MKLELKNLERLLKWFKNHGHHYPWSNSSDPWEIWVSEVMLQQTTATTVSRRFSQWMERYPSPDSLAKAGEEDILRDWEGLGYYNRVRNLAAAAREIVTRYGGRVPAGTESFRALPGVGDYIAAAVGSMAFGKRKVAIDANLKRIALRLTGQLEWNRKLEEEFRKGIEDSMSRLELWPGYLNAALMQFGQIVCVPRIPKCTGCPLEMDCVAHSRGMEREIPRRERKQITRISTRIAILLLENRVFMIRRSSGIARGMWIFPAVELVEDILDNWKSAGNIDGTVHSYTRFRERLQPELFRPGVNKVILPDKNLGCWLKRKTLENYPMPTAYRKIAEQLKTSD